MSRKTETDNLKSACKICTDTAPSHFHYGGIDSHLNLEYMVLQKLIFQHHFHSIFIQNWFEKLHFSAFMDWRSKNFIWSKSISHFIINLIEKWLGVMGPENPEKSFELFHRVWWPPNSINNFVRVKHTLNKIRDLLTIRS